MAEYNYLGGSNDVYNIQQILYRLGYTDITNQLLFDGYYGPRTANAVKELQTDLKNKGLYNGEIDGLWGPKTAEAYKALTQDTDFVNHLISKNSLKPAISTKNQTPSIKSSSASPAVSTSSTVAFSAPSIERPKETFVPKEDIGLGTYIINWNYPQLSTLGRRQRRKLIRARRSSNE